MHNKRPIPNARTIASTVLLAFAVAGQALWPAMVYGASAGYASLDNATGKVYPQQIPPVTIIINEQTQTLTSNGTASFTVTASSTATAVGVQGAGNRSYLPVWGGTGTGTAATTTIGNSHMREGTDSNVSLDTGWGMTVPGALSAGILNLNAMGYGTTYPLTTRGDLAGAYLGLHPGSDSTSANVGIIARTSPSSGITYGAMVFRRYGVAWNGAIDLYVHPNGIADVDQLTLRMTIDNDNITAYAPIIAPNIVTTPTASYVPMARTDSTIDSSWIRPATSTGNGVMSTTDKIKLDSLSGSTTLYFNDTASDIGGYNILDTAPDGLPEEIDTINVLPADGEKLIESYITRPGVPNSTVWRGGPRTMYAWRYVSTTAGTTQLVFRAYRRTAGGTETEWYSFTSADINDTTVALELLDTVQSDLAVNATDRPVMKVFAKTTHPAGVNVSYVHSGTTHYSRLQTTLDVSSSSVSGSGNNGYMPKWGSVTGTNTDTTKLLSNSIARDDGTNMTINGGMSVGTSTATASRFTVATSGNISGPNISSTCGNSTIVQAGTNSKISTACIPDLSSTYATTASVTSTLTNYATTATLTNYARTTDTRFTDARTPTGNLYAVAPAGLSTGTSTATATAQTLASQPTIRINTGTGTSQVITGADSRLTNARTPTIARIAIDGINFGGLYSNQSGSCAQFNQVNTIISYAVIGPTWIDVPSFYTASPNWRLDYMQLSSGTQGLAAELRDGTGSTVASQTYSGSSGSWQHKYLSGLPTSSSTSGTIKTGAADSYYLIVYSNAVGSDTVCISGAALTVYPRRRRKHKWRRPDGHRPLQT